MILQPGGESRLRVEEACPACLSATSRSCYRQGRTWSRERRRRTLRLVAVRETAVVLLGVIAALFAAPADAVTRPAPTTAYPTPDPYASTEHVASFDVKLDIHRDGALHVNETIRYDFEDGSDPAGDHGVIRRIPTRRHVDSGHDWVIGIRNVHVQGIQSAGDLTVTKGPSETVLKINNPDAAVPGIRTYVIDYDVPQALFPESGTDALYWDVIGGPLSVPTSAMSVRVSAPVEITTSAIPGATEFLPPDAVLKNCDQHFPETYSCPPHFAGHGRMLTFADRDIGAGEEMNLMVGLSGREMDVSPPLLRPRINPFAASTLGDDLGLVAVGVLAILAWLFLPHPHWRRKISQTWVDVPPPGVSPALAGVLRNDGTASDHQFAAILVDLATRGHLRFEEYRTSTNKLGRRIVRGSGSGDRLETYEAKLMHGLFGTRESAELKTTLEHGRSIKLVICDLLEEEVRRRGWMRRRPTTQRKLAVWLAALLAGGGVLFFVLAVTTGSIGGVPTVGLGRAAVAFLAAAAIVRWCGRQPPRTIAGSRVVTQVDTYADAVVTWAELPFRDPAVDARLVSLIFPYAVAFGQVDALMKRGWASIFHELEEDLSWYKAADGPGTRPVRTVAHVVDFMVHPLWRRRDRTPRPTVSAAHGS